MFLRKTIVKVLVKTVQFTVINDITVNTILWYYGCDEFLQRFITVDETWIHHYTPDIKEPSEQWLSVGERVPKKT